MQCYSVKILIVSKCKYKITKYIKLLICIICRPSDEYFQKNFKVLEVKVVNATVGADYYPNIALKNLFFMPTENYSWTGTNLHLKLLQETAGIYTFGFYGRNYKIDEIQ